MIASLAVLPRIAGCAPKTKKFGKVSNGQVDLLDIASLAARTLAIMVSKSGSGFNLTMSIDFLELSVKIDSWQFDS